jgi:TetR/AcrR family transcriptional regulator of autoinduction and epiphytic fitness
MAGSGGSIDGRKARSQRTRENIVEAMLGLLEEGNLRPTAAQVAERAGLSVRSVFQHFADLEDLFRAVSEQRTNAVVELFAPFRYVGSLADRIACFIQRRARLHETVAPVRRAAELQAPFSDTVAERLDLARNLNRYDAMNAFAPELERARQRDDVTTAEAVTVVASWASWDTLRRHQQLSVVQACAVVARTLEGLLSVYEVTVDDPVAASKADKTA